MKGSPKLAPVGQRVLFKQLNRACATTTTTISHISTPPSEDQRQKGQEEKQQERLFLINLSRICKQKKALDSSFDQKKFVKEGLVMKFGDAKAKAIMLQVYSRIKTMRKTNE